MRKKNYGKSLILSLPCLVKSFPVKISSLKPADWSQDLTPVTAFDYYDREMWTNRNRNRRSFTVFDYYD